eukprot:3120485-Rhodomonas_salina.3
MEDSLSSESELVIAKMAAISAVSSLVITRRPWSSAATMSSASDCTATNGGGWISTTFSLRNIERLSRGVMSGVATTMSRQWKGRDFGTQSILRAGSRGCRRSIPSTHTTRGRCKVAMPIAVIKPFSKSSWVAGTAICSGAPGT